MERPFAADGTEASSPQEYTIFSPEIIRDPATSAHDVLKNRTMVSFFTEKFPKDATAFYIAHLKETINFAFSGAEPDVGYSAFQVLNSADDELVKAILSNSNLYMAANGVLNQSEPNNLSLYRLTHITYHALLMTPNDFPLPCGFILQLFAFIDICYVSSFFEAIIMNENKFTPTQKWFHSVNLVSILIQQLKSSKFCEKCEYSEVETSKVCHLIRLIKCTSCVSALSGDIPYPEVIDLLSSKIGLSPDCVESEIWEALKGFYSKVDPSIYRERLILRALEIVNGPSTRMPKYRVSAMSLVKMALKSDKDVVKVIKKLPIGSVLLSIIFQFSSHSIMLNEILGLIDILLDSPEASDGLSVMLIQPLIQETEKMESRSLLAFTCELVELVLKKASGIKDMKGELEKMAEFGDFVENVLAERRKILKCKYGE